jgi:N,N'-diacetyllegionaminate synthase
LVVELQTIIIAEAGVNHNGDIDLAKKLIEGAALAGADYVKFQTFSAEKIVTRNAPKAGYQLDPSNTSESQFEMLQKLELGKGVLEKLIQHAEKCGIKLFSTGFDVESVNMLEKLGQEILKIPSGEITNLPLLQHIGKKNMEVLLSTGMSNLNEVGNAIKVLENAGTEREKITILHCTSSYPAPMEDINLMAMHSMRDAFNVSTGYSDHSIGIEVAIAAVALGAKVIEKHFTLDKSLPGPDHKVSLNLAELKDLVIAIRNIEKALGDGRKRLMPSEYKNLAIVRQVIVAKKELKKGEVLTEFNITTKRAGIGISPVMWNQIIGTQAKRDYTKDEVIDL